MIIHGRLLIDPEHAPRPGWVRVEQDRVVEIGDGDPPERPTAGDAASLICPAFIDAHIHLPQIDSIGCEAPELLTWLEQVIFPTEQTWADATVAARQTRRALQRMLRAGTLGYAGYLTAHSTGLDAVGAAAAEIPLRGLVGQVLMDREAPDALTSQPIAPLDGDPPPHVRWSVNPRFAVSCSDQMLRAAATAGAAPDRFVQTHLAESVCECERVRALFPDAPSYTAVYDDAGLLHERTLLAHCLHLDEAEWATIAERLSVVVHCPSANTFLRAGRFDLAAAARAGVRLALGTDVAAGPDVAMPRVARAMIEVAKMQSITDRDALVPHPIEAWRLITEGNADAIGMPDAGRIEVGAAAMLLVLSVPFDVDEHLIGRLIYTWRDEYITHRVIGDQVFGPDLAPVNLA